MKRENQLLKEENETLKQKIIGIEQDVKTMKTKITKLERDSLNTSSLEENFSSLKEEMKTHVQDIFSNQREMERDALKQEIKNEIMEASKEDGDKRKRESNLIFYNVPESNKETGQEREREDRDMCNRVFQQGMDDNHYEMEKVIRLGRYNENNKPRPILVKLSGKQDKFRLLGKAKNLKNCENQELKKVIVAPDLTAKEREADKKLRDELKVRRERGENGLYIHRGEIKIRPNF